MMFLMLLLAACSTDLPEAWVDAEPLTLSQAACDGNPYETIDEHIAVTPREGAVDVDVYEAHFRCAQDVEGFVLREEGAIDILIQPVDMDPAEVAGCDCLYDLSMVVDGVEVGEIAVTVYRRWDNLNDNNEPVVIDTAVVTVE